MKLTGLKDLRVINIYRTNNPVERYEESNHSERQSAKEPQHGDFA